MQTIKVTSLNDHTPEDIQKTMDSIPKEYHDPTARAVAATLDIDDVNDNTVKDTTFAIFDYARNGKSTVKPSALRKALCSWMATERFIPASEAKRILKDAEWPQNRLPQGVLYVLFGTIVALIVFISYAFASSPASNASGFLTIDGKNYDAILLEENGKTAEYELVSAMSNSETVSFRERFHSTYTKPEPAVHYANQAEPGTNNFGPRLAVTTIDDINSRLVEKLVKDPMFIAAFDHASLHQLNMSHQKTHADAVMYLDDTKRFHAAQTLVNELEYTAIVNQHGVMYESLGQIPNKDGGLPTLTAFSTQQDMGYALLVKFTDRLPLLLRIDCDLQPSFPQAFTSVPRYGKQEKVATQAPRPYAPPASMQPPKPKPQVVRITTPKPAPKPKPTPTPSNPPKTTPPTPGTTTPGTTTVTTTTTPTPTPSNPPKTTPPTPGTTTPGTTTTPTTTQPTTTPSSPPKTTTPTPTPSDGKKDPEAGPNSQEGHAGNAGKPSEPTDAVVPPVKETDPNVATAPATEVVEPIKDAAPATIAPNNAAENNSTEQNPSNGELADPDAAAPAAAPAAPAPAPAPASAPAPVAVAPAPVAPAPAPAAPAMPEQKIEAPATLAPEPVAVEPAPQAPIGQAATPAGPVEAEAPVIIDNAPVVDEQAPEVAVAETPAEPVEIELMSKSVDPMSALLYAAIAFALTALASFAYSYKQKRRRTM